MTMDISDDETRIAELLRSTKTVAVLGIKMEPHQPAFYVPKYLADAGVEIVPVPVYYPEINEILGRRVFRKVAEVPGPIDIVDVFRRSQDVAAHLDDLLVAKPRCVWLQLGIRDDKTAAALSEAGILVVQDRCLMVDHERFV
jgi:predicted CoA-binding protein